MAESEGVELVVKRPIIVDGKPTKVGQKITVKRGARALIGSGDCVLAKDVEEASAGKPEADNGKSQGNKTVSRSKGDSGS